MVERVLIMAGGTGGHVFPALAVAHLLEERNKEVHWLGTDRGLESTVVPSHNIPLHKISITGLRGKGFVKYLTAPFELLVALVQSIQVIRDVNPDVVLGMGGFVSGPGGLAAWLMRKKLIIHEQNAVFGMTNKMLSHFAACTLTGFPKPLKANAQIKNMRYIGNPIRSEIVKIPSPIKRLHEHQPPFRLLVMGGSQGALSFNQILPEALTKLAEDIRPIVWHIAGKRYLLETEGFYSAHKIEARIDPFVTDIEKAYDWADLIICRSGALTVAELSAAGLASILVPFPFAVDDHQTVNAGFLKDSGAAILLSQQEFSSDNLAHALSELIADPARLAKMSRQARSLRKIDATERVVDEICG